MKPDDPMLQWHGKQVDIPPPMELVQSAVVLPDSSPSLAIQRLIQGENLGVMSALLKDYKGKVDLIYADPPFLSGKSYRARTGHGEDSRRPEGWKTAEGFRDEWNDRAEYLGMLYSRLHLMHALLADTGTLYLHLDWHASAYARVLLDEIFGPEQLLNEIIWTYHGPSPIKSAFKRKHDTIYVYTKSKKYTFNSDAVRVPYDPSTVRTFSSSKAGFGKRPDLERGKVPEDWWYFPVVARLHNERTGYPTQKPEALLERIVLASSNPGDLVADFFCGSGTAIAVARRLGRDWLACDISPLAINTSRRRLLLEAEAGGFSVWVDKARQDRHALEPRIEINARNLDVEAKLTDLDPEALIAFELDWDFDGQLFRSEAQSVRGWQQERIDTRLGHSYPQAGSYVVAAHAVDSEGQTGLVTKQVQVR
ncbi:MAG: DNA-methyltransferase [Anaerolineales bacterium]